MKTGSSRISRVDQHRGVVGSPRRQGPVSLVSRIPSPVFPTARLQVLNKLSLLLILFLFYVLFCLQLRQLHQL